LRVGGIARLLFTVMQQKNFTGQLRKHQIEKTVAKIKDREYYQHPVYKGKAKDKKKPCCMPC